nr:ribonuclease H-like domain-containing protein [Tanacetum cinerariifolium]
MVPDDKKAINYETLDVKSPIVDYESQVLGTMVAGDVHVYKLSRLDERYRHFSTFSRMLEVLDRQDVLDLHKIVMEKFPDSDPEGEDTSLPPPLIASPKSPQMVSFVMLPILKKGKYILWTMKMDQYLAHINYALWEVILNGNGVVQMTKDEAGNEIEVPPITAQQILARTRERIAKSTLLMAIPHEYLARFHGIKYAKTLWAAIKTRFGGNAKSKKMQKNVLKQQFEIFSISNSEGLDKGYDRFQRLFSLLKIHGAGVSIEDTNHKFLRSLPLSWSNISLIMRNKPGIDNLGIDDLYNNLKVYEADIKGSSGSSSNSQNMAFVSVESTSSTNELNAAYSVSTATGHSSQAHGSSSYTDELMFSFFTNRSSSLQLDNEDLEQIDQDDLEMMDLKWQVAMLSMRLMRFYKKIRRKLEYNGKEQVGFDKTKVECFNCHRKWHFAKDCRTARNPGNKSRDAGNAWYKGRDNGKRSTREEDDKALVVQDRLGYDSQFNEKEVLDVKEEEVTETVFDTRSSDEENNIANDQFKKSKGYHVAPLPLTGNYMPPKPDISFAGLDDSIYKFKISKTVTSLTKDVKDK